MEKTVSPASDALTAFLDPGIDRVAFIGAWLTARSIPHRIVELAGKRHVIVRFAPESYAPAFRLKLLVAHHDRVEGSPGANDNGAACFQLMQLAERLGKAGGSAWKGSLRQTHNTVILFSDGEEAAGAGGVRDQGSFALGTGLKSLALDDADVYVFDACGRGDVLVLSTAGTPARGALARKMADLRERAREIARDSVPGDWISLLTPYSDNAGFLASGIASQVVTVLPHEEADTLLFALAGRGEGIEGKRDVKELERLVTGNRHDPAHLRALSAFVPETWRLMHGPRDNASTLTSEAFVLMRHFLDCLAASLDSAD